MKAQLIGVAPLMIVNGQNLNFAIAAESVAKLDAAGNETKIADWRAKQAAELDESAEA